MPARRTHCQKIPRLQNGRLKNSCGRSLATANGCNSVVLPSSSNNREAATVVERLQELSQAQAQIDEVWGPYRTAYDWGRQTQIQS